MITNALASQGCEQFVAVKKARLSTELGPIPRPIRAAPPQQHIDDAQNTLRHRNTYRRQLNIGSYEVSGRRAQSSKAITGRRMRPQARM